MIKCLRVKKIKRTLKTNPCKLSNNLLLFDYFCHIKRKQYPPFLVKKKFKVKCVVKSMKK